jgi:hypothetical protein
MEIIVFEKETYYRMLAEMKRTVKDAVKEIKTESKKITDDEQWIDGKQAQLILKCKRDKLRQLREDEKIKVSKHGRKVLYSKPSLYEFLEINTEKKYV